MTTPFAVLSLVLAAAFSLDDATGLPAVNFSSMLHPVH
jgi:hypothetical protein